MVTANVFRRTFHIMCGSNVGTAFTIDYGGRQYLVTALHIYPNANGTLSIMIRRHDQWVSVQVRVVGRGAPNTMEEDVLVLALDHQISPSFPLPPTPAGIVWGQEVYFLGFPYGLYTSKAPNDGYPLPLVKGGLMSGTTGGSPEAFLLDGHNNPGFSGGPAVFRPVNSPNGEFQVFGIVSAYRTEHIDVYSQTGPTGLVTPMNTGIVICPSIEFAVELIEANPIGAPLTF